MCGIAGGWWHSNDSSKSENKISNALSAMQYRGPDSHGSEMFVTGSGVVALGHARLSIIDLSSGGHQPMKSSDGQCSIVFNGEIYNYRELRDELIALGRTFSTKSDTEVLLAAWQQWGVECLSRLNGMFAFVVFDRLTNTLTCVRDAFGIKPFFYTQENGGFLFASEVSGIRALKQHKLELEWQRAYDYLVHNDYDNDPKSFVKDVLHLLPGHILTFDISKKTLSEPRRWWNPSTVERKDLSFTDAAEMLREKFLNGVRLNLRSDVKVGAALSGGIDSSAVVCAMRYIEPDMPIHTFSYIAKGSKVSEEAWVDRVNSYVGADENKIIIGRDELVSDLDSLILAQGEPFGSTSIYAQYKVFQVAKERGVTVTLDGQGADEMLAGYQGYPAERMRSLIEEKKIIQAWRFLNDWAKWPNRSRIDGIMRLAGEFAFGRVYEVLRIFYGKSSLPIWLNQAPLIEKEVFCQRTRINKEKSAKGRRVIEQLLNALTKKGLPSLLRHGDRNSMRFSVESRVPFLNLEMAEFLLTLPEAYLISPQGETKHIFRAAMRGIVPDDVLDRRDKIGFETPEREWLLSMSDTIREWLSVDLNLPFYNQSEVLKEFELIVDGKRPFSWQVWRWINFSRWYVLYIA